MLTLTALWTLIVVATLTASTTAFLTAATALAGSSVSVFIGIIAAHFAPLVACSIEGFHHFLCVVLRYFDIRELLQ